MQYTYLGLSPRQTTHLDNITSINVQQRTCHIPKNEQATTVVQYHCCNAALLFTNLLGTGISINEQYAEISSEVLYKSQMG